MPTFPQFALESLFAFWLLLGYYRLAQGTGRSFQAKRWQLRLVPVLACGLPLVPTFFFDAEPPTPTGVQAMSLDQFFHFQFPEYSFTLGTLLLVVYFVGVVVSSFRLMDRCWAVSQFLQKKGNQAIRAAAWQAMPTALMSHLMLNWRRLTEAEKETWAGHWLPIHPAFGWEALLVELLLVFNWFNPLAYRYRESWAALYADWQVEKPMKPGFFSLNALGFVALSGGLGLLFIWLPAPLSPSHRIGGLAANIFNTTIFENKIERPHEYSFEWGGAKTALKKFANPNGYSADLEMELADFQATINQEIRVYRDGEPMQPGTLSIIYKSSRTGSHAYINGIDPKKVVLLNRQNGHVFNDSLGDGDHITLFGDTGGIYLSKVEIRIKDPNAGYEPPHFVPQINHLEATMEFQIIARQGKRALVKIDPDHPNAARILALYGDATKYETVRLPGFRTNRHYLTEDESLASKVAAANTTLTFLETDAYYLPEYQGYQEKDVRMAWGQMVAAPSNLNYDLDSFLLSIVREPKLLVGDDTVTMVSFEVVIAGKNRRAKSYWTYRTGDLAVKAALENIEDETSIFFEKIVVYDAQRNRLLFPASFAFNVGNPAKNRELPVSNTNYFLKFGEKTEVVAVPGFKIAKPDSMVQPMKKRLKKK